MNKKNLAFIITSLILITTIASTTALDKTISLNSKEFIPTKQTTKEISSKLSELENKHALIQLDYIPNEKQKKQLEKQGIILLEYIPNYAWYVTISEKALTKDIKYITEIPSDNKIDKSFIKKGVSQSSRTNKETIKLNVILFKDATGDQIKKLRLKYGNLKEKEHNIWEINIKENQIQDLIKEDIIQWIEEISPEKEEELDNLREAINANTIQEPPYNLHGQGYVAATWDSGSVYAHEDFWSRVIAEPDSSPDSNHATFTAGILLGDGTQSQDYGGTPFQWKGIATLANLVSYQWDDETLDLNQAINTYNVDVSSNSWGWVLCDIDWCDWMGDYRSHSPVYDQIVGGLYGDKITIVGASGNDGDCTICQNSLPNFPYGTVNGPIATAKNVLSVSATQTDLNEIWSGSSRGPTDDGRIKPDISAPGCKTTAQIKSTKMSGGYATACGTSASAPAISGSAILIYEDYNNFYSVDPLPSTVRAIIYQTAEDLGNEGPDYIYGYGEIDIQKAIDLIREDNGENKKIFESEISQSEIREYSISTLSEEELKVTIVWDDKEATSGAGIKLMNNLDLRLISPSGETYYPWVLDKNSPSEPATTGIDTLNNMEQIQIQNPEPGNWKIQISGTTIPYGPQEFSLISSNNLNNFPEIPHSPNPENQSVQIPVNITLSWESEDPDQDQLKFNLYFSANENPTMFQANLTENTYDLTLNYSTNYYWKIIATDSKGAASEGPIWTFTTENEFACYNYVPGDVTNDSRVIGGDVTFLVNYFRGLATPPLEINGFYPAADVTGDCRVIGGDVTFLVNYFRGLNNLSYCPEYPPCEYE